MAKKDVGQAQVNAASKVANKDQSSSVYKSLHKPYTTIEPRTKSALQMVCDSRNSDTQALASMELPLDLGNQKNVPIEQQKYRIDLQDIQRLPKKIVSKDDGAL